MNDSYVLLEVGSQPYFTTFQDLDGRLAFSMLVRCPTTCFLVAAKWRLPELTSTFDHRNDVEQKPNLLVRLMREPQWSQQHPEIMGPNTSFMYFGPEKSSGYLIYGNGPNQPMNSSVRQKKGVAKYAPPLIIPS
jgi:hypothetical protein